MRLQELKHGPLHIPQLAIEASETWCILGRNQSGKSLLASIIADVVKPDQGTLAPRPKRPLLLSFETQQAEYERALEEDDTDFMDRLDYGASGLELLMESGCSQAEAETAAKRFRADTLLSRGFRQFSSGELRKIHLLRAALGKPDLLILDEPYEGLDTESRSALDQFAVELIAGGLAIILIANRLEDVADWTTHLAFLERGYLSVAGPKNEVLKLPELRQLIELSREPAPELPSSGELPAAPDPLVRLRNGTVRYGDITQFAKLYWTLRPGQHTLVSGPNGCGKSTLLSLITGDHPQCYSNDLNVVGFQRGNGESIWEVKARIGIVSPALHRDYRVGCDTLTVALSGFFDSIGLYQTPTRSQILAAQRWLAVLGLETYATAPFRSLSYGQQRLALIARGLVKQPPLLILDEPTQGLDDLNRRLVLACVERLATLERSTLLFVSHRMDERLSLFHRHLRFETDPSGSARYRVVDENL